MKDAPKMVGTSDLIRFAFKMMNDGYGICDSCDEIVDGQAEGWHDSEKYGEGNICQDCYGKEKGWDE